LSLSLLCYSIFTDLFVALKDKFGAKEAQLVKLSDTVAILDEEAAKIGGQARRRQHYARAASASVSGTAPPVPQRVRFFLYHLLLGS